MDYAYSLLGCRVYCQCQWKGGCLCVVCGNPSVLCMAGATLDVRQRICVNLYYILAGKERIPGC
jgi:hypothetical protein